MTVSPVSPDSQPADGAALLNELDETLFAICWLAQKQLASLLAPYGLTIPQYHTLLFVSTDGVGTTMSQLARQTHQSLATMTGIVDRLVRQQLVERRGNPADRRIVLVALTDKGRNQLSMAHHLRRHYLSQAINQLDEPEQRELIRLLKQFSIALGLDPSAVNPMRYNEGR